MGAQFTFLGSDELARLTLDGHLTLRLLPYTPTDDLAELWPGIDPPDTAAAVWQPRKPDGADLNWLTADDVANLVDALVEAEIGLLDHQRVLGAWCPDRWETDVETWMNPQRASDLT